MKETALRFGSERHLVGVLAEPEGGAPADRPALLLFNQGFGQRVGPHRINVELARHLAACGFASLRFDLSGLGDSGPRAFPPNEAERAVADVVDAMDLLHRRRGIERFALLGMCSGVDVGHASALADPRIVAAAFMDGYAYKTLGYHLWKLGQRLRRNSSWLPLLRGVRRLAARLRRQRAASGAGGAGGEGFFERRYPTREQFRDDVAALRGRGVRLFFIFSHGWWYFNHLGQFAEMLGERRLPQGIEVEYWTTADHMLTAVRERERLVRRITQWLFACVPARQPDSRREDAA